MFFDTLSYKADYGETQSVPLLIFPDSPILMVMSVLKAEHLKKILFILNVK